MQTLEERKQNAKQLFSQINELIKTFVKDICKDTGFTDGKLYIRTDIQQMHFVLSLFHVDYQQTVSLTLPLDEFLQLCMDKDKLEHRFNHEVRRLLVSFGQTTEKEIVLH